MPCRRGLGARGDTGGHRKEVGWHCLRNGLSGAPLCGTPTQRLSWGRRGPRLAGTSPCWCGVGDRPESRPRLSVPPSELQGTQDGCLGRRPGGSLPPAPWQHLLPQTSLGNSGAAATPSGQRAEVNGGSGVARLGGAPLFRQGQNEGRSKPRVYEPQGHQPERIRGGFGAGPGIPRPRPRRAGLRGCGRSLGRVPAVCQVLNRLTAATPGTDGEGAFPSPR